MASSRRFPAALTELNMTKKVPPKNIVQMGFEKRVVAVQLRVAELVLRHSHSRSWGQSKASYHNSETTLEGCCVQVAIEPGSVAGIDRSYPRSDEPKGAVAKGMPALRDRHSHPWHAQAETLGTSLVPAVQLPAQPRPSLRRPHLMVVEPHP